MTLIDRFKETMAADMVARANSGNDVWPAPRVDLDAAILAISPLILPSIADAFSKLSLAEATRCFRFPSSVAELMYLFMDRAVSAEDGQMRVGVACKMLLIIEKLRKGDGFNRGGFNRIASATEAKAMSPIGIEEAKMIGVLIALLNMYCEYTYFAFVAFGREVHGPYAGYQLTPRNGCIPNVSIVRDYYDLTPDFWQFPQLMEFKTLRLDVSYKELTPTFDFMGRLSARASFPESSIAAALAVDGCDVPVSCDSLGQIITPLRRVLSAAHLETTNQSEDEILRRLLRAIYWACRHLFIRSGQNQLAPPDDDVIAVALNNYLSITSGGHSPLSLTLRSIGTLSEAGRILALQRLLDPAEQEKYI